MVHAGIIQEVDIFFLSDQFHLENAFQNTKAGCPAGSCPLAGFSDRIVGGSGHRIFKILVWERFRP
jgi:hypothetical protein